MAQLTGSEIVRSLIQVIALALPAIALLLQYSLQHLERIEEQYLSRGGYLTPAGRLRRTREDVNRQQWSGFFCTMSLIPLAISGILLLLYLLLSPIMDQYIMFQQFLVIIAIISIIIFFIFIIVATIYSGGGVATKSIKFLLGRYNIPKMEQSNISDFCDSTG